MGDQFLPNCRSNTRHSRGLMLLQCNSLAAMAPASSSLKIRDKISYYLILSGNRSGEGPVLSPRPKLSCQTLSANLAVGVHREAGCLTAVSEEQPTLHYAAYGGQAGAREDQLAHPHALHPAGL